MSRNLAIGIVLVLLGGGVLWVIAFQPQFPQSSVAATLNSLRIPADIQSEAAAIDSHVAATIRQVGEQGISWGVLSAPSQVSTSLQEATLSAQVSTTPEEVWKTLREEGAQAVVSSLAKSAEVSVNSVSTEMMNEARYQYCIGVVQQYENSGATSP